MNIKTIFSSLLLLAFFIQTVNAQKEETHTRKMTIVTKTIDENGKETVTTVVKEGDEVTDEEIDKIIQQHGAEGNSIDVEVNLEDEKTEKITITEKGEKGVKKKYKIIKETEEIDVENDGEKHIIILGEEGTDEGEKEIKIIKKKRDKKDKEGKKMMFITEDGDVQEIDGKEIKTIKKKSNGKEVEIEINTEGDHEMIWNENEEGEEGDVIIIEEETTEEVDKDGKTIKKTIKKTKKIVKKGN